MISYNDKELHKSTKPIKQGFLYCLQSMSELMIIIFTLHVNHLNFNTNLGSIWVHYMLSELLEPIFLF